MGYGWCLSGKTNCITWHPVNLGHNTFLDLPFSSKYGKLFSIEIKLVFPVKSINDFLHKIKESVDSVFSWFIIHLGFLSLIYISFIAKGVAKSHKSSQTILFLMIYCLGFHRYFSVEIVWYMLNAKAQSKLWLLALSNKHPGKQPNCQCALCRDSSRQQMAALKTRFATSSDSHYQFSHILYYTLPCDDKILYHWTKIQFSQNISKWIKNVSNLPIHNFSLGRNWISYEKVYLQYLCSYKWEKFFSHI